jgi:hypothetical protein
LEKPAKQINPSKMKKLEVGLHLTSSRTSFLAMKMKNRNQKKLKVLEKLADNSQNDKAKNVQKIDKENKEKDRLLSFNFKRSNR